MKLSVLCARDLCFCFPWSYDTAVALLHATYEVVGTHPCLVAVHDSLPGKFPGLIRWQLENRHVVRSTKDESDAS